jgi:hypothetical protein
VTAPEFDALVEKAAREAFVVEAGLSVEMADALWDRYPVDHVIKVYWRRIARAALTAAGVEDLVAEVERLREYDTSLSEQIEEYIDANVDLLAEVERLDAIVRDSIPLDRYKRVYAERDALAAEVEETWQWGYRHVGGITQEVHAQCGMTAEYVARNTTSVRRTPVEAVTRRVTAWKVAAPALAQSDPDGALGGPGGRSVDEEGK